MDRLEATMVRHLEYYQPKKAGVGMGKGMGMSKGMGGSKSKGGGKSGKGSKRK